jgi:hypothetical protein
MMGKKRLVFPGAALLLAALCCGVPNRALAQAGQTDVGELSALGGGVFGAGSHPTVNGGAGVAFSRYGMALFDTSFFPLGTNTIQNWPDRATVNRSRVLDFGFDFHIRFPIKHHWEPYGIAGAGALWNIVQQNTVDRRGITVVRHFDQWNGALHTGGGLRYYIGHDWGIRPECKVIVSKGVYTQLMVGIFWVTPPDWP